MGWGCPIPSPVAANAAAADASIACDGGIAIVIICGCVSNRAAAAARWGGG